jgi:hypothetical protein
MAMEKKLLWVLPAGWACALDPLNMSAGKIFRNAAQAWHATAVAMRVTHANMSKALKLEILMIPTYVR